MNNLKNLFFNIGYSVFANGVNLVTAIIMMLLVPKIIGVSEYGLWQLYAFYGTYVSFFHLGWPDANNLIYGGVDYQTLPQKSLRTRGAIFYLFQTLISIFLIVLSYYFISENKFILMNVSVSVFIMNTRTYNLYLLQASNRVKDFAKISLSTNFIFLFFVISSLFIDVNYQILIIADMISKTISLIYSLFMTKELFWGEKERFSTVVPEIKETLKVGLPLMLAYILSIFIMGIYRWMVENKWGLESFAQLSLSLSVSNMILVFMNAISIAFFPYLRRMNKKNYAKVFSAGNYWLTLIAFLVTSFFFIGRPLLLLWLPNYETGIFFLSFLFPMAVFESKNALLVLTFMKTIRLEKTITKINLFIVVVSISLSYVSVYVLENMILVVVCMIVSSALRSMVGEYILMKRFNDVKVSVFIYQVMLTIIFVLFAVYLNDILSFILYILIVLILFRPKLPGKLRKIQENGED